MTERLIKGEPGNDSAASSNQTLFRGWWARGGVGGWGRRAGRAEQECVFDGMLNSLRMKTQQKQGKVRWSKEASRKKKNCSVAKSC